VGRRSLSEVRRVQILEALYRCLADYGLEGATISRIAGEAEMTPSLVMHYFRNKDEMIVELVELILQRYEETFLPRLGEIDDPGERLRTIIDTIFGTEWDRLVDMGVFTACYSLSFRNQRVRESFRKMYLRLREVLIAELGGLMEDAVMVRADPGKLADLVISLLEGFDFYKYVMGDAIELEGLGAFFKENAWEILTAGGRGQRSEAGTA